MFIKNHSSAFCVKKMCQVFKVGRSAYYDWLNRPLSRRQEQDIVLLAEVTKIFQESNSTYGHRRVKKQLKKQGIKCSNERVKRLMRENGLISVHVEEVDISCWRRLPLIFCCFV